MPMHAIEDFVECAVKALTRAKLGTVHRRSLIHTLYHLQELGDGAFTRTRCTRELVDCHYSFLFDNREMADYNQHSAAYERLRAEDGPTGPGGVYRCDDREGRFPQARGKLCVDSGTPAWERMVAAGKITGPGALPVALLDIPSALLEVKQAVSEIYGWDALLRGDLMALFLLADGDGAVSRGMSDQQMRLLLGVGLEQYRNGELDGAPDPLDPATQRECVIRGAALRFSHYDETGPDHCHVYYGYTTLQPGQIPLWGRRIPLEALVVPQGMPRRINPFDQEGAGPSDWLARAGETAQECLEFFLRHTGEFLAYVEHRHSPGDGEFVDPARLERVIRLYQSAFGEHGEGPDERAEEALNLLADLLAGVTPPTALSSGHPFLQLLLFYSVQGRMFLTLPEGELRDSLKAAVCRMLPEAARLLDAIHTEPEAVGRAGESQAVELLGQMRHLPVHQQVTLLDQLWRSEESPLVDRLVWANTLHALLMGVAGELEIAYTLFLEELGPVPPLEDCVRELERQLGWLDQQGMEGYLRTVQATPLARESRPDPRGWQPQSLRAILDQNAAPPQLTLVLQFAHPEVDRPVLVQLVGGKIIGAQPGMAAD